MRRHSKFFGIKLLNRFALITFLGCISLFSVGFSSWAFVKQTTINDITVNSADISSRDLITINYITVPKIGPDGMVKDGMIVTSGFLTISFTIDNNYSNEGFLDDNNIINLNSVLVCSDVSFLTNYISKPTINNLANVTIGDSSTPTTDKYSCNISFAISDFSSGSTTTLLMKYPINGDMKKYYNNSPTFDFKVNALRV